MMKSVAVLLCVWMVIALTVAMPRPDDGDQGGLEASETRRFGFPLFWYRQPVYDDDSQYDGFGGQDVNRNYRSSSPVSIEEVGAGWGR